MAHVRAHGHYNPRVDSRMDVEAILSSKRSQFKTTDVSKEIDLQYDLGNLLAGDLNVLDVDYLK